MLDIKKFLRIKIVLVEHVEYIEGKYSRTESIARFKQFDNLYYDINNYT